MLRMLRTEQWRSCCFQLIDTKSKWKKKNASKVKHKLHQQNEAGERKEAMVAGIVDFQGVNEEKSLNVDIGSEHEIFEVSYFQ